MARAVDVLPTAKQADGWNMITNTRVTKPHPALSTGTYPTGLADGANTAAGSPGANLGTGMNLDIYTPAIET